MPLTLPWSKKHKRVTLAGEGGMAHSLSNSFAQPLDLIELIDLAKQRGDLLLIDQYSNHHLGYTPNGGSLDLREEVAKLYGPKISADNILIFTGAQVALPTAAQALTNGHTHAIVFDPAYQSTQEAPLHAGSQVTRISLKASNNWQIDPLALRAAIRENTRYIVVNEPYNPAGTLMSLGLQHELTSIAAEHGIYILSDEVYRLLEHDPKDRLPAMADAYERGISAVTLSKPWGACGVTIGWLAFQDLSIKQRLVDVQYFGTACPSRASEIQAIMVLRASDVILEKNLRIIRRNFRLLESFMSDYSDLFEWVRPQAGAVAFIRFKGPLTSNELGEQLAKAGIGIKPAYCFTDVVTDENDYFRVGYGEEKMPRALKAFADFVEQHRSAWLQTMRGMARSRL
eukprot:CAMPEP_0115849536 /NCGR_PEP_ID=MMETSP0287-20121206/11501_1 /TAXON_ID=412157 /ORGANISM="Chrysochromulina rotalis, Strain UIO044" /LENGTH=398 /DNA_ID=CAMNT_0003303509 /DNA_START=1 /DNA_END=1197 /DNA_ORIENTATION=+